MCSSGLMDPSMMTFVPSFSCECRTNCRESGAENHSMKPKVAQSPRTAASFVVSKDGKDRLHASPCNRFYVSLVRTSFADDMAESRTCSIPHICSVTPLLWLVPASHTRPPSIDVPAILFVGCPEFPAQSWLFIKDDEQMYGECNRYHGSNRHWVGLSEYNPQPDPSPCEALVHGVPHVAVETHHYQSFRRSDRGRCAASRPAEVPDAAQGNSESQHRRKCSQPSPMCCAHHFHAETEPLRQQPEPQGEERCPFGKAAQQSAIRRDLRGFSPVPHDNSMASSPRVWRQGPRYAAAVS